MIDIFSNPIFIVSAPRAGSTLLYELLSKSADFYTIGAESHSIYAQFPHLSRENDNFDSGSLGIQHADDKTCESLRNLYLKKLINCKGEFYVEIAEAQNTVALNFLEKTPRNALNIPFLLKVFPRAKFIFLHRAPEENIASLMEAWAFARKSGYFITFPNLPDWPLGYWCFLLPKGWRKLRNKTLAEISCFQWSESNRAIIKELKCLPRDRWVSVSYREVIDETGDALQRLCDFCLVSSRGISKGGTLPLSASTLTPPHPEKWRQHEQEISSLMSFTVDVAKSIASLR